MKHEVLLFSFTFTVALSCKYNPPFEMHFSYLLDDSWFLDHPFYTVMLPYELFYTRQQLFIVQTKVMNLKLQEYNTPSLQKHSRCRAQGIPKHWLVFYTLWWSQVRNVFSVTSYGKKKPNIHHIHISLLAPGTSFNCEIPTWNVKTLPA